MPGRLVHHVGWTARDHRAVDSAFQESRAEPRCCFRPAALSPIVVPRVIGAPQLADEILPAPANLVAGARTGAWPGGLEVSGTINAPGNALDALDLETRCSNSVDSGARRDAGQSAHIRVAHARRMKRDDVQAPAVLRGMGRKLLPAERAHGLARREMVAEQEQSPPGWQRSSSRPPELGGVRFVAPIPHVVTSGPRRPHPLNSTTIAVDVAKASSSAAPLPSDRSTRPAARTRG